MIYLRKLFKQDLRDGKQIAFPTEPSNVFFSFNFHSQSEREIEFRYKDVANLGKDGTTIRTRLYPAGSEARIDGELKAFLRDELNASIGDIVVFNKKSNYFEFSFFNSSSSYYDAYSTLLLASNHVIALVPKEDPNNNNIANDDIISSLQIIYYGAPGTGKSYKIKNEILVNIPESEIYRTTFHPDTDYSSFVGCYKPISSKIKKTIRQDYSIDDLASILEERYINASDKVVTIHSFAIEFADYFNGTIASFNKQELLSKTSCPSTYHVEINKMTNLQDWLAVNRPLPIKSSITYEFSPQVFTDAYVKAWNNPSESIYLVIEEINRGNCAQIFGDLFQLLDRKEGVSEYPIVADSALRDYLEESLNEEGIEGISDGKLKLPSNLNIIATMNTSDQSLFPMDSAFKRRWDWEYVPITFPKEERDESVNKLFLKCSAAENSIQKQIRIGEIEFSWKTFLKNINTKIENATHSDDKKLGYWFIKLAEGQTKIPTKVFVSKVIFYLWNDIFKDLPTTEKNPFAFKCSDGNYYKMNFNTFFETNFEGQTVENIGVICAFMKNLQVEPTQISDFNNEEITEDNYQAEVAKWADENLKKNN